MNPVDRRRFLAGSLSALSAGGAAAAAVALTGTGSAAASAAPDLQSEAREVGRRELGVRLPFDGRFQSGVLTPRPAQATYLALDSTAPDQATLFEALQAISTEARQLMHGVAVEVTALDDPPPDSGILGAYDSPDSLTVTVSFGHSLFDDRYGLAHHRPRHLTAMPQFALDQIDPARTGGDVLLQIAAGQRDTVVHAVRELMRLTAGSFAARWILDGFTTAPRGPHADSSTRNLFAFRDGTANPDVSDTELMKELVWVQPDAGEPDFAVGGTYVVVRTIRQHVEFWDRVGMLEQEQMIGRDRVVGAPLGGTREFQQPDYRSDPHGERIPLTAHIRLANPRTAATADQRIVRRSFNYHRGLDEAGDIDCGLIFTAYNQDPERQFAAIQRRLEVEPMTDYVTPVGGGYFFAPRGSRGLADWVGSGLSGA